MTEVNLLIITQGFAFHNSIFNMLPWAPLWEHPIIKPLSSGQGSKMADIQLRDCRSATGNEGGAHNNLKAGVTMDEADTTRKNLEWSA